MMRFLIAFCLTITCAGCLSAQVIAYEIDTGFDTGELYTMGSVYDLGILENGDIVIVSNRSSGISAAHEQSMIDNSGNLIYNFADASAVSLSLYKYGYLSQSGGGGSLGFKLIPPITAAGENFIENFHFEFGQYIYGFPGFTAIIGKELILDDETILAPGRFHVDSLNLGPEWARHLVRVDSTGAPVEGFPMVRCEPWWAIMYNVVQTSEGKYVVSGEFTEINGIERNYIARLNADFSVDTSFHSPFLEGAGYSTIFYQDSSDKLWVSCGDCDNNTGIDIEEQSIIKLTPDGEVDPDFQIPDILTFYENGESFRLPPDEIMEDIDGTFILAGTMMLYNGAEVNRLIKITPNGELIPGAFGVLGSDEADWGTWAVQHPAEASILALKKQEDGKLLIGGQFSSFGGEPYSCMVRLQPNGFIGTEDAYAETIGLKVWPNPAKCEINFEASEQTVFIQFQDLTGQTILEISPEPDHNTLLLKDLPQGTYLLRCTTDRGIATEKVVITK